MYASPYSTPVAETAPAPSQASATIPAVTGSVEATSSAGGQDTAPDVEESAAQPAIEKQDTAIPVSVTTRGEADTADSSETRQITRVQVITAANVAWTQFALSMIVSVAMLIFLLRHSLAWHRFLVQGKTFVIKHPVLDIAFVVIATLGTLLLQTAGYIR